MTPHSPPSAPDPARLLVWYDGHRRRLPWRAEPGERADPYRVWLSEMMLQQTTVAAVIPYFHGFLRRWPGIADLAAASLDEVLTAWAGLGYYARARNLHAAARHIAWTLGGRFPENEAALGELPGIGPYTAAAIAAIAFDQPATVVDGNVERVMARVFAIEAPLPTAKPRLKELARTLTPDRRAGDYAQAVMDLGATVCAPRAPRCLECPWNTACAARATGIAATLPRRLAKPQRPTRRGVAYWLVDPAGAVLLRRRPTDGLLGGMSELPTTVWSEGPPPDAAEIARQAPLAVPWHPLPGLVRHIFSHFHLELAVVAGRSPTPAPATGGWWVMPDQLDGQALPSVMRKIARHALAPDPRP